MTHSGVTLYARETVQLLQQKTSRSVSAKQSCWPGNPVDYRIWRVMQKCVYCYSRPTLYKTHVRNTSDLMQRINDTWTRVSQNVDAVGQWRKWLYARVKAKGHHLERLLN